MCAFSSVFQCTTDDGGWQPTRKTLGWVADDITDEGQWQMSMVLKLLGTLVSIAAGLAGAKLIDILWKAVTGEDSPKHDDDMENSLRATLAFAVISGTVSAIIRVLSQRGTMQAVNRFNRTRDMV